MAMWERPSYVSSCGGIGGMECEKEGRRGVEIRNGVKGKKSRTWKTLMSSRREPLGDTTMGCRRGRVLMGRLSSGSSTISRLRFVLRVGRLVGWLVSRRGLQFSLKDECACAGLCQCQSVDRRMHVHPMSTHLTRRKPRMSQRERGLCTGMREKPQAMISHSRFSSSTSSSQRAYTCVGVGGGGGGGLVGG